MCKEMGLVHILGLHLADGPRLTNPFRLHPSFNLPIPSACTRDSTSRRGTTLDQESRRSYTSPRDAIREGQRTLALVPIAMGPMLRGDSAHHLARIDLLVCELEKALDCSSRSLRLAPLARLA
jgi:hypothetical protein